MKVLARLTCATLALCVFGGCASSDPTDDPQSQADAFRRHKDAGTTGGGSDASVGVDSGIAETSTADAGSGTCPNGTAPLFVENWTELPLGIGWVDGQVYGNWTSEDNSGGTGIALDNGIPVLSMTTPTATSTSQTYGEGILSNVKFGDFDMTVPLKTVQQLRQGSPPNTWEVAWLSFHYIDRWNSYYILLKPNGWELGKEIYCTGCPWDNQGQLFLATGSSPTYPPGAWYNVRVKMVGPTITVWVDGSLIVTYTDTSNPLTNGEIFLYNEDSSVRFGDIQVCSP